MRGCRYEVVLEGSMGAIDQRKKFHGASGSAFPGCGPRPLGHASRGRTFPHVFALAETQISIPL